MRAWYFFLCLLIPAVGMSAEPHSKMIYGLQERVGFAELGLVLSAKLDTGADSSSLDARSVRVIDRQGEARVVFDLPLADGGWQTVDLPLASHTRIRRRSDHLQPGQRGYHRRPVVMLALCLGDRSVTVPVNLADRRDFDYPVLIGVDALQQLAALVDPGLTDSAGRPRCDTDRDGPAHGQQANQQEAAEAP